LKLRIASLSLLALCLVVVPATAQTLYENGPVNGQVDAWTVNFGYSVTDSAQVNGTVTGFSFWAWLIPGDSISNIQLSIGSAPFGSDLFNGFVSLTQSNCFGNSFGYNVCDETASFNGPTLNGTAWFTLQNANVPSGDPVYWDENSGAGCSSPGCPSQANESAVGSIPSEAFTVSGGTTTTTSSTTTGTTPEPSSIMLFGSGILGLAGVLRRKLF
jgi:hypothetical protein